MFLILINTDQDSKLKFSLDPGSNDNSRGGSLDIEDRDIDNNDPDAVKKRKESAAGFQEWQDAMRMVVRLPGRIPPEFRKKVRRSFQP